MVNKKEAEAKTGDPQDRMVELLEELVKWTRLSSKPGVKTLLLDILKDDERKMVYQLSDGRGSVEIAKLTGVGASTIPEWWKQWNKVGISEAMPVRGGERAKRLFSLDDFGIEVPQPIKATMTEKPTTVESQIVPDVSTEEKKDE